MLRELVDKVLIHEKVKTDDGATQRIEIIFNFVGYVDLSPTPEKIKAAEEAATAELIKKKKAKKEREKKAGAKHRAKKKKERLDQNEGHMHPKRICPQCGMEFWPNTARQIYCNKQCAYDHHMDVLREKRREEKGDHTFRQKTV